MFVLHFPRSQVERDIKLQQKYGCSFDSATLQMSINSDLQAPKTWPDYVAINGLQRSLLAIGSGFMCLINPARGHQLTTFGETSASNYILSSLHQQMIADEAGAMILKERPRITNESVMSAQLDKLPIHTFGHQYYRFLNHYGYFPDERLKVQFVENDNLAYVMQRYREIHDLTHVLLGMPTNMLGEITVKKFEALQLGLPMCILAATFSTIRLGPVHSARYVNIALPWIMQVARQCRKMLLNVYFEREWKTPIDQLRYRLNIPNAPRQILAPWLCSPTIETV